MKHNNNMYINMYVLYLVQRVWLLLYQTMDLRLYEDVYYNLLIMAIVRCR